MTSQALPIAPRERLFELDAIRGVALLGIYIMNMPAFASSFYSTGRVERWPAWWDRGADWLGNTLFSGKFNSMFSLLFAVGFTILLERLEQQAPERAKKIYLRRLAVLFAFGAIHACVFWTGDVLHLYALLGLVLLPLRRLRERWLWVAFALCLSFPVALGVYGLLTRTPADIARQVEFMRLLEASNDAAYGKGSFIEAAREHTREMIVSYSDTRALRRLSNFLAQLGTTLVLGLILGRRRFFQRAGERLEVLPRAQRWLLGIGLCSAAVYGVHAASVHGPSLPTPFGLLANTCYNLSRVAVMGFYVVTIVRAANSERWRPWLEPIATAGRMPLTNYLLQTLIATFIFYGWGLGFWGRAGPALQFGLAIAIFFLIQVPYSRLWLRRFPMGPMERLWRRLSYGRAAPSQKPVAKEISASG